MYLKPGGRICTVTDSESIIRDRMPLSVYFPETVDAELRRYPPMTQLHAEMATTGFTDVHEVAVEFPYLLTDCRAYETKTYSALHLISQGAFERGVARMRSDLLTGQIACNSRYTLLWGAKKRE
ncbi:MAG: hypothetical protein M1434_11890 [Chloroflexi bacterium]|nr:hypothetical protein [Chloroflexota bacterium]MCL5275424.1 hypothetical protein [Chloroflexota bacterium]